MTTIAANLLDLLRQHSINAIQSSDLAPKSIPGVAGHVGLQLAACIFGLGFTGPASPLRPALLPVVGGSLYLLGQTCSSVMPKILYSNLIGGITCGWLTQYIVSGILKQENFEDNGPPISKVGKHVTRRVGGTISERVWFALNTINAQRRIGTPQQAKNVPSFSSSNPTYVPSRRAFLLRTGAKMVGTYLLLDLMTSGVVDVSQNSTLFAASKVPFFFRLSEITSSELSLRTQVALGHWVGSIIFLQLFHSTLSFFTVLPGCYEPKDWPPLFGSFFDVWSIRRYWGTFYHQLMRFKLEAISKFFTEDVLQLQKATLLHRYVDIFGVFFASGLCHVLMDIWGAIPLRDCGALQFFCAQAFGVMFEDGIQALYRKARGVKRTGEKPKVWIRVLGFVWTAGFLVWSTPAWIYPGMSRAVSGPEAELLPFSVVNVVKKLL